MSKYRKGDILVPIEQNRGFEEVEVVGVINNSYYCNIVRGNVTIPIHTLESQYILKSRAS